MSDEEKTRAELSAERKKQAAKMRRAGHSHAQIATELGISKSAVGGYLYGNKKKAKKKAAKRKTTKRKAKKRARRYFSPEMKTHAAKMLQRGIAADKVAKRFGVTSGQVRKWTEEIDLEPNGSALDLINAKIAEMETRLEKLRNAREALL